MESETDVGSLESADLVSEKRRRMLARLEARHIRNTAGTKTPYADTADFDKLLAKATYLMNSSKMSIEPEFLQEVETALTLIPLGRQSRRLKEALNVLRRKMQEQIGLAHHQTTFSFSSKKENVAESKSQKEAIAEYNPLGPIETTAKSLIRKAITVTAEQGKELVAKGDDGEEIIITDVTNCVIRVPFRASTVHVKSVKHTTLIFAPIKTSLLMRSCENLTVAVAAQQVRIHDSHHIRFYIEVRGALIIEDCDGIEVAPYNVIGFEHDPQNDNWRNVQDFKVYCRTVVRTVLLFYCISEYIVKRLLISTIT
ncbi:Tubulin-specific chaperone [Dirofilaria immitis]